MELAVLPQVNVLARIVLMAIAVTAHVVVYVIHVVLPVMKVYAQMPIAYVQEPAVAVIVHPVRALHVTRDIAALIIYVF
jgi:hypothetical protein